MSNVMLRPSYWASVSGGKDSLYMLKLMMEHRDEYPLDGQPEIQHRALYEIRCS